MLAINKRSSTLSRLSTLYNANPKSVFIEQIALQHWKGALEQTSPITLHAFLRERANQFCNVNSFTFNLLLGHNVIDEPESIRFWPLHRPACKEHVFGSVVADYFGKAYGAAVDEGHAEATTVYSENGFIVWD